MLGAVVMTKQVNINHLTADRVSAVIVGVGLGLGLVEIWEIGDRGDRI